MRGKREREQGGLCHLETEDKKTMVALLTSYKSRPYRYQETCQSNKIAQSQEDTVMSTVQNNEEGIPCLERWNRGDSLFPFNFCPVQVNP